MWHYNTTAIKLTAMINPAVSIRQVLGELFVTAGVILLLFVFYEAYWTNLLAGEKQAEVSRGLDNSWQAAPALLATPVLGEGMARLYIPAFGPDYHFAVVEGTDQAHLMAGPGHYPQSQQPGQQGNFAIAGHRIGKGAPFHDLGELKTCDAIVIETQDEWITYRVLPVDAQPAPCLRPEQADKLRLGDYAGMSGRRITTPEDVGVINPVPESEAQPTEALLTLTTCHPEFSNAQRMIIHAMEVEAQPKSAGRPAALDGSHDV